MRILIFTCEFTPLAGGVGSFNRDLVCALHRLGHQVTVYTRDYSPSLAKEQKAADSAWADGIEVIRIPWPHPAGFYTVPFRLKRFLLKRRADFDCVLITSSKAHAVSSKIPLSLWGRYSLVVHGDEADRHFNPLRGRLALLYRSSPVQRLFQNANAILAISKDTVARLARYGFNSRNLFLGVDPEEFFPVTDAALVNRLRDSFDAEPGTRLLVTAGRLEIAKGHDVLIRAFSRLFQDMPDVRLFIAGDGRDRDVLQKIAEESAAASRIVFLGRLTRRRLRDLFQVSYCFALTSRRENFGLVFLEANACGKAVVGGRTGGVPEAVEDGVSGLLVDPESVEETERVLRLILQDPVYCERIAQQGYSRYLQRFTNIHMAQELLVLTQG